MRIFVNLSIIGFVSFARLVHPRRIPIFVYCIPWDYDRNGAITPEMVTLGTGQRFYWKCRICNRSYLALPSRIAEGSVCAKHHISLKKGTNDLETKHPELLKYWDYEKNDIAPSEIFGGGERVVYWKCETGHS